MRLDFCCACGANSGLEHHHLLPRSEGGTDQGKNILTLCFNCHGIIHGVVRRNASSLTKLGLARARAAGKHIGRPHRDPEKVRLALALVDEGMPVRQAAATIGIGRATLYEEVLTRRRATDAAQIHTQMEAQLN